jgi:HK97 family phage major capsid protein
MSLTTASGQSILTPDQVAELVIQPLIQSAVATRVSSVVPTSSHRIRFPVVVSDPATSWTAEGAEINVDDTELDEVIVVPDKLAGLTVVTNELLADTEDAAMDVVGDGLVRDLRVKLDAAFFGDTIANGPDGLASLLDVQVVEHTSFSNLDPFAEAISLAETVGSTLTAFVGNPTDTLHLAKLKVQTGNQQPLLGMDPAKPTQRLAFGVPILASPAVPSGTFWGLPLAKVFVVIREDASVVADTSPYFSSDRTAVRATLRVGFAFPHQEAIIRLNDVSS